VPEHLGDHMQPRALGQTGEVPEWRSSCGCQWPSPARSHSRAKECEKLPGCIGVPGQPLAAEHWHQMEAHGVHVIVFGGLCDEDLGHGITHSG
jgi:hypothetical protein